MKLSKHRPNVRTIRKLSENDGITLRDGYAVTYASGYQVADEGMVTNNPDTAMKIAREIYGGNCGIWLSEGLYYVDHCRRISTKREAIASGRIHKQISILEWKTMKIIYC